MYLSEFARDISVDSEVPGFYDLACLAAHLEDMRPTQ